MFLLQETDALVAHTSRRKVPPLNKLMYAVYVCIARYERARDAHKSTESNADEHFVSVSYSVIATDGHVGDAHKSTESSADGQFGICLIARLIT